MTRRAGHAVNDGFVADGDASPPEIDGFDVELSVQNVEAWGGDPALYVHFLRAATTASPTGSVLTLSALAAWRAGVVELRSDALARLATLEPDEIVGAGAALGLDPVHVAEFGRAQQLDPFAWPPFGGAFPSVRARLGGFVGLGGPWAGVPRSAATIGPGLFTVVSGGEPWSVSADAFGARIARLDAEDRPSLSGREAERHARLVTSDSSYLAYVVVGEPR